MTFWRQVDVIRHPLKNATLEETIFQQNAWMLDVCSV